MFYLIDKLGIDVSTRLSGVYRIADEQKEGTSNPFPIKANAEGHQLYSQQDFTTDDI